MNKKITFVHSKMIMGGAEVVLLRLFEALNKDKIHYNLVLFKHGGELLDELSPELNVQYVDTIEIKECLKNCNLIDFIKGLYCRIRIRLSKTYEEECIWLNKISKHPNEISTHCVISFTPLNFMCLDFVSRCKAELKIVWIHSCSMPASIDEQRYIDTLQKFDVIVCVSRSVQNFFVNRFPIIADKTVVIYNLIEKEHIIKSATVTPLTTIKSNSILTVGRLSPEKGQEIIPLVLRKLLDNNYDVYWYIIGDGIDREKIENMISKYSLEDRLIIMGNQLNPFPYMRQCDIYVQPSRYEGFCTTTNEARILCKPVVASNILPMQEQFVNGKTGVLCELKEEAFYDAIKKLLDNPNMREELSSNLKTVKIDNNTELKKFYDLIQS